MSEMATEKEVLEFANKLRAAGQAEPIEALMPSIPSSSQSCLVANALNFNGRVCYDQPLTETRKYAMYFPSNMSRERATKLAAAVGCSIDDYDEPDSGVAPFKMPLPDRINRVVENFDDPRSDSWPAKYRRHPYLEA